MARTSIASVSKHAVRRGLARVGLSLERAPNRLGAPYHLARLLETYRADCVLDVGANRGQFASMLRGAGYRGPLISFEPVPEAYVELARLAAKDPLWTTHQVALGDQPGMLTMNVAMSSSVSSFLPPTDDYLATYEGMRTKRAEEVPVETLDRLASELPYERIFLKIDTQGYDLRVLAGASALVDRVVGIEIEMSVIPIYEGSPYYIESLTTMRELGFTPSGIFPVESDPRMRAYEFDGVFVRS